MTKLDISSVANASLPAVPYTWKQRTNTKQQKRYQKSLLESFCKGFIDFGDTQFGDMIIH